MKAFKELKKIRDSVPSTEIKKAIRKDLQFFLIMELLENKKLFCRLKVCIFINFFLCPDIEVNQHFDKLLFWLEIKRWVNVMEKFAEIFIGFLLILFDHLWAVSKMFLLQGVIWVTVKRGDVITEKLLPTHSMSFFALKHALYQLFGWSCYYRSWGKFDCLVPYFLF